MASSDNCRKCAIEDNNSHFGCPAHLVRLDDGANEREEYIGLKGTQTTGLHHSLQPWNPASWDLPCQLLGGKGRGERGRRMGREEEGREGKGGGGEWEGRGRGMGREERGGEQRGEGGENSGAGKGGREDTHGNLPLQTTQTFHSDSDLQICSLQNSQQDVLHTSSDTLSAWTRPLSDSTARNRH